MAQDSIARALALKAISEGGQGGTSDYSELTNKPSINSVTLTGNKSLTDLGIQGELTAGSNITINNGTISATDTTYTAGTNISIVNGEISATDTTYTAGQGISIWNDEISAEVTTNDLINLEQTLGQQIMQMQTDCNSYTDTAVNGLASETYVDNAIGNAIGGSY